MPNWRRRIDPSLKLHLEKQINETSRHKNVYKQSRNPGNAQLWVSIANLSKQIFDLNLKLNYLERALKEIGSKPASKKKKGSLKKVLQKY